MTAHIKRAILTIVFFGLLFGPAVYSRWFTEAAGSGNAELTPERIQELLDRYGFVLRESAAEAGIEFVHEPPQIDARLEHIGPQVAAMGANAPGARRLKELTLGAIISSSSGSSRCRPPTA